MPRRKPSGWTVVRTDGPDAATVVTRDGQDVRSAATCGVATPPLRPRPAAVALHRNRAARLVLPRAEQSLTGSKRHTPVVPPLIAARRNKAARRDASGGYYVVAAWLAPPCDGRTRGTSSRAVPVPTSLPDAAATFQGMTDWQIIIGSSLVLLVIVTLLAVVLMGAPRLG